MTESASTPDHGAGPDQGGQDALTAFLACADALQDKLYGYISRRIPDDPHGAEDAYEETLQAFFFRMSTKGCAPREYAPLIFGIAGHVVKEYWRKRHRRSGVILTSPSDLDLATSVRSQESSDPFESVNTGLDLERAFALLSEKQRHALVLLYVDGLTQEEGAGEMGISRGSLRRLLASARSLIIATGVLDGYRTHQATIRTKRTAQAGTSETQA